MNATVLTYGTFDLFHVGHLRLLRRCRELGERLVVGCSTDEFNREKGKETVIPYAQRAEILGACRFVDEVFPERRWDQKRDDVRRLGARTLVMGDDWAGKFDELGDLCSVVYLPRTPDVSTTDTRRYIQKSREDKVASAIAAAERLLKELRQL